MNRKPDQSAEGNPYETPMPVSSNPSVIQLALDRTVVFRALIMSLVVGSVLVTINHGMCIYYGHFDFTCFWQSALTFLVPYSVSTVSSVLAVQKSS